VAELDRQGEGTRAAKSSGTHARKSTVSLGSGELYGEGAPHTTFGQDGSGASRFFPTFRYQAKAPASERPKIDGKGWPTVKPLALMRWLVRLVTPPGGTVLDPFTGSGTTLQAARNEGFDSIGIERDEFAYLLTCRRLGLPELVPAAVVDPVLVAIEGATTYDDLIAIYVEHKAAWNDERTAAAKDRRAAIEVAA